MHLYYNFITSTFVMKCNITWLVVLLLHKQEIYQRRFTWNWNFLNFGSELNRGDGISKRDLLNEIAI